MYPAAAVRNDSSRKVALKALDAGMNACKPAKTIICGRLKLWNASDTPVG